MNFIPEDDKDGVRRAYLGNAKRLADIKQARDDTAVAHALDRIRADAADPTVNIMPALLQAVAAYVTEGEIINALETVFGTWTDTSQP